VCGTAQVQNNKAGLAPSACQLSVNNQKRDSYFGPPCVGKTTSQDTLIEGRSIGNAPGVHRKHINLASQLINGVVPAEGDAIITESLQTQVGNIHSLCLHINDSRNKSAQRPDGPDSIPGKVKTFLFTVTSKSVLGPIQPHTQWVLEAPFPKVKRPGRAADH
jgi:hypothetical protein